MGRRVSQSSCSTSWCTAQGARQLVAQHRPLAEKSSLFGNEADSHDQDSRHTPADWLPYSPTKVCAGAAEATLICSCVTTDSKGNISLQPCTHTACRRRAGARQPTRCCHSHTIMQRWQPANYYHRPPNAHPSSRHPWPPPTYHPHQNSHRSASVGSHCVCVCEGRGEESADVRRGLAAGKAAAVCGLC